MRLHPFRLSVSIGHDAVTVKPDCIIADTRVSQASGSLWAKTMTIRPSLNKQLRRMLGKASAIPCSYHSGVCLCVLVFHSFGKLQYQFIIFSA